MHSAPSACYAINSQRDNITVRKRLSEHFLHRFVALNVTEARADSRL